jgi:hypothetical protein
MKTISRSKRQIKHRKPKVNIEMTSENITINGGLEPILRFMEKLDFNRMLGELLATKRGATARYSFEEVIEQIITAIMAGARSISDISAIWSDTALRKFSGYENISDPTNIARILKSLNLSDVIAMEDLSHRLRGQVWKTMRNNGRKFLKDRYELWIDVDSTVSGVFGKQEGAAKGYNPVRKGQKSYHPLIAFNADTSEVLHSWFRSGDAYTGNGAKPFLQELFSHLPKDKTVTVRADSGFFNEKTLEYLEAMGHHYLIKVKLKGLKGLLFQQTWQKIAGNPGWESAVFIYKCGSWGKARHFVAVRKLVEEKDEIFLFDDISKEYEYFCYVTDLEGYSPWQIHKTYGKRATCETWIEECKSQTGASKIRTSEFIANSILFQCAILAYNLLKWMAMLAGHGMEHWEVKTIRRWLILKAAKLVCTGRQLFLKIQSTFLKHKQWIIWKEMIERIEFNHNRYAAT